MANLDSELVFSLDHMCPVAAKAALGTAALAMQTEIDALQAGSGITYGTALQMAVAGVAAANAAGSATVPAAADHVHAMPAAAVVTALASAATDVAFNTHKLTGVVDGVAATDAATKGQLDIVSAAGINVVHVTHTITLANMQAVAGGVKFLTRSTVLPANARIIGALYTFANVDNAGDTMTVNIKSGGTTPAGILDIADASTGGGAAKATKVLTGGVESQIPWLSFSGQTIATTVTSTGAEDLNTVTKGAVEVDIFYVVVA